MIYNIIYKKSKWYTCTCLNCMLIKLSNSTDQSLMVDDQLLKGNHLL